MEINFALRHDAGMKNKILTIDFLRHGETLAKNKMIGSTDVILSNLGHEQMHRALAKQGSYTHVVTSPLQRCLTFSQSYAAIKNIPLSIEKDLREYHFGVWENQLSTRLWEQDEQAVINFWQDPQQYPPPQAEDIGVFKQRVENVFMSWVEKSNDEHILFITHGGVIRCLLASLLEIPFAKMSCLQIDHASLSRIVIYTDNGKITPSIKFVNQWVKP